jgi:hypothetical protein
VIIAARKSRCFPSSAGFFDAPSGDQVFRTIDVDEWPIVGPSH